MVGAEKKGLYIYIYIYIKMEKTQKKKKKKKKNPKNLHLLYIHRQWKKVLEIIKTDEIIKKTSHFINSGRKI